MKRIIDYKQVDMTDAEFDYFKKLLSASQGGKHQIRDTFDVDDDGCITLIRPLKRQIEWGLLIFFQNLMVNQRLRQLEEKHSESVKKLYDLVREEIGRSVKKLYDLVREEKNGKQDDNG